MCGVNRRLVFCVPRGYTLARWGGRKGEEGREGGREREKDREKEGEREGEKRKRETSPEVFVCFPPFCL